MVDGSHNHGNGEVTAGAPPQGVRPERPRCDLVMKGGITSGVVYPAAISDLHKQYRFANIGGASAGAIAAAATAAAEHGDLVIREGGSAGGFPALEQISTELTNDGLLEGLFAPTKTVRPAFDLLLALQKSQSTRAKVTTGIGRLVKRLWLYVAGAMLVGLLLLSALTNPFNPSDRPAVLGWLGLVVLLLVFGALGLVGGVAHRASTIVKKHLPTSFFGLCTGMPTDESDTRPEAALTPWLHAKLQLLSGKGDGSPDDLTPLTFADLRRAGVTLTVMTTDVSSARPVQMPEGFTTYWFMREDLERLFPRSVVDAMVANSETVQIGGRTLHRLTSEEHLPVIVATRMSLSFPVLLSAVPLYTIREHPTPQVRTHWISDGGISSNFPIHLFDSWLPRHPTFALSFLPTDMAVEFGETDPCDDREGPPPHVGTTSLVGFLSQILDTMQNWRDSLQAELPGFSDRVQVVPLNDDEGGMNLTMPPDTINRLIDKGHEAAAKLQERFDWDRHRLHRFQMTMGLLEQELGPGGSLQSDSADDLLTQLLGNQWAPSCRCQPDDPAAWPSSASTQTMALRDLVAAWATSAEAGAGAGAEAEAAASPAPPGPVRQPPAWTPPETAVSFSGGTKRKPSSVLRRTPRV